MKPKTHLLKKEYLFNIQSSFHHSNLTVNKSNNSDIVKDLLANSNVTASFFRN